MSSDVLSTRQLYGCQPKSCQSRQHYRCQCDNFLKSLRQHCVLCVWEASLIKAGEHRGGDLKCHHLFPFNGHSYSIAVINQFNSESYLLIQNEIFLITYLNSIIVDICLGHPEWHGFVFSYKGSIVSQNKTLLKIFSKSML